MAIAAPLADSGPDTAPKPSAPRRLIERVMGVANRNMRLTAALLVLLIFACFAAATALQMQRDYAHSLAMGARYADAQAQVLADETGHALERLVLLGIAYVNAVDSTSAAQIIQSAESDRILNIALADADGNFVSAMKGRPLAAARLAEPSLERALSGRTIVSFSDPAIGSSPMTLVFQADTQTPPRFVVMPLDPRSLLPPNAIGESALFDPNGSILALGEGWDKAPPAYVLRSEGQMAPTLHHVEYDGVRRIVALAPVPGWPLAAVSSVRANVILSTWYASLPLYLFVILGPALAGAALAFVLAREFERTDRARTALHAARAMGDANQSDASQANSEPALMHRLADAERRAEEAEQAKATFTSAMSHELFTPLNTIIGFSEVIKDSHYGPVGDPRYCEYASHIAASGRDLHTHIARILEYVQGGSDKQSFSIKDLDIRPVLKDCLKDIENEAADRGISLEYEFAKMPLIRGDEAEIKRILTNILSNAVRYTPEGGTIRVEAGIDEDAFVLHVRDSGQGFAPDMAARASEPRDRFVRTQADENGRGLGMAMELAHRMGGVLRFDEAAGEDNWAELRLPIG